MHEQKVIKIEEKEIYSDLWKEKELSILQSWQWGEVKKPSWQPIRIEVNGYPIQILTRKIPLIGKDFGYIPKLSSFFVEENKENVDLLTQFAANELKLSHLVVEMASSRESIVEEFRRNNYVISGKSIQPQYTNIVSLVDKSEEDLWNNLKPKFKRNINKSIRQETIIESYKKGEKAVERFYSVMETIFARTNYVMHGIEYFKKVWETLSEEGLAEIFIAKYGDTDLGAYFVAYDEKGAYEFYGGVTNEGRNYEAGYLLKWESIKKAQKLKKDFYDHWGIAPIIGDDYDKNHDLYNISRFKEGFGGEIITYIPQMTAIFDSFGHSAFKMGENLNKFLLKIRKKK